MFIYSQKHNYRSIQRARLCRNTPISHLTNTTLTLQVKRHFIFILAMPCEYIALAKVYGEPPLENIYILNFKLLCHDILPYLTMV
jgi:hypothetical protein